MKTSAKKLEYLKSYYENNKEKILEKQKQYKKEYYQKNKEKFKAQAKEWEANNKDKVIELRKEWRNKNREAINKYSRNWKQENKDKIYSWTAKRRGSLLKSTPIWITKNDIQQIAEFYLCSEMFSMYTGEKYHVDHIIPLRGKKVNGLHVPSNLQVITAKENLKKSNSFNMFNRSE